MTPFPKTCEQAGVIPSQKERLQRAGTVLALQARDAQVVQTLYSYRYLRADQLAALLILALVGQNRPLFGSKGRWPHFLILVNIKKLSYVHVMNQKVLGISQPGQEVQDTIFQTMSADQKIALGSALWQLAKALAKDKINYVQRRPTISPHYNRKDS